MRPLLGSWTHAARLSFAGGVVTARIALGPQSTKLWS